MKEAQLREMAELGIRVPFMARSLDRGFASIIQQAQVMGVPLILEEQ